MECPYLEKMLKSRICSASVTQMVPGAEETDEYCNTEEHYRCPMLLAHVLRGGRRGGAELRSFN